MRSFGFWVLVMLAFISGILLGSASAFNNEDAVMAINHGGPAMNNRKLKEKIFEVGKSLINQDSGSINPEESDYPCFDPSPSSKAAIQSGPIEHETPLMPYIPRPIPKHGSP